MNRGKGLLAATAATFLFLSGGCAVNPLTTANQSEPQASAAERDSLADAALAVETAPWPRIEEVSFITRLAGGENSDRMTRSDAIAIYLDQLNPEGARFSQLAIDARANLGAADRLISAAGNALAAPRLSMNDVSTIEDAIQALRDNRQIYTNAARQIEKSGEPVDKLQLDAIRNAYAEAIRDLGRAADALADRIEADRSATYAAPTRQQRQNLSGV